MEKKNKNENNFFNYVTEVIGGTLSDDLVKIFKEQKLVSIPAFAMLTEEDMAELCKPLKIGDRSVLKFLQQEFCKNTQKHMKKMRQGASTKKSVEAIRKTP